VMQTKKRAKNLGSKRRVALAGASELGEVKGGVIF